MRYDLPTSLLKKTLPAGAGPVRVHGVAAQDRFIEAFKEEIAAEIADTHVSTWNQRKALVVPVDPPGSRGFRGYYMTSNIYVFFAGDELQGSHNFGSDGAPLAGAAHLFGVVAEMRERIRAERAKEQKREKIRGLKARSIEGQIAALAARMGFTYRVDAMTTKVSLEVRFDEGRHWRDTLEIDIPFGRAQEVIEALPPLVTAARAAYLEGARARIGFNLRGRFYPPKAKP